MKVEPVNAQTVLRRNNPLIRLMIAHPEMNGLLPMITELPGFVSLHTGSLSLGGGSATLDWLKVARHSAKTGVEKVSIRHAESVRHVRFPGKGESC